MSEKPSEEQLEKLEQIDKAFASLVEDGLIDYYGKDEDGKECYRITEKGKRVVEAMPEKAEK